MKAPLLNWAQLIKN